MYSHCIFCQGSLGRNEVIEAFPVGRRLAFDAAKGRLWVVCRKCERWNLTPLEERWEAIEDAERLFSGTRLRASTEHIGLARLREGLELVRIGRPLRPEFAAWRYGDQFGRRRRRAIAVGTGVVAAAGLTVAAGVAAGLVSMTLLGQAGNIANGINGIVARRTRVRIPLANGEVLKLRSGHLERACILQTGTGDIALEILHHKDASKREALIVGEEAASAAALLLPKVNSSGASAAKVQEAVRAMEERGGSDSYLRELLQRPPLPSWQARGYRPEKGFNIQALPVPARLALEMALHEQQERLALEGELRGLTLAWQAAEEVAGIADDLLAPPAIRSLGQRRYGRDATSPG